MNETTYSDEIYLEIPSIGNVEDADVYFKVESVETPVGQGNVSIDVLKEAINCTIDEIVIYRIFLE